MIGKIKSLSMITIISFGAQASQMITLEKIGGNTEWINGKNLEYDGAEIVLTKGSDIKLTSSGSTPVLTWYKNTTGDGGRFYVRNFNGYWFGRSSDHNLNGATIQIEKRTGVVSSNSNTIPPNNSTTLTFINTSKKGSMHLKANSLKIDSNIDVNDLYEVSCNSISSIGRALCFHYIIPNAVSFNETYGDLKYTFRLSLPDTGKLNLPVCNVNGVAGREVQVICEGDYEGRPPTEITIGNITKPHELKVTAPANYTNGNAGSSFSKYKLKVPFTIYTEYPGQYQINVPIKLTWP